MTLVFKKSRRFLIVYYIGLYLIYVTVFFYSLVIPNKDNDYFDMRVNSFYKVELLFTATRVAVILRNKINSCRKAYRF